MHYVCTLEIETSYIGGLRECGYGSGERWVANKHIVRVSAMSVTPHHGAVHSQHLPLGAVLGRQATRLGDAAAVVRSSLQWRCGVRQSV